LSIALDGLSIASDGWSIGTEFSGIEPDVWRFAIESQGLINDLQRCVADVETMSLEG
jgi:hypothetical protein